MIIELEDKDLSRKLYEEVFEDPKELLDYYYRDKCIDNRIIVSVEDDEIVSMAHFNPYYMSLDDEIFKSYYVVSVGTAKNRRRQGHMRRIFEKAFELFKEEKIPFIFLLPVEESTYSGLGFEKICDFPQKKIADYNSIRKNYDLYCTRDDDYLRRMKLEEILTEEGKGGVIPENSIIMAGIIDLDAFNEVSGQSFGSDKEALAWLRKKKIYICEEL